MSRYGRVAYREVYPGVDMVYYGNQRQLEYDFIVAPGADPQVIKLAFEGAREVQVAEDGDLVLRTAADEVRQHRPRIYQERDGEREPLAWRYVKRGRHEVGFEVTAWDRSRPLIIDPVLVYSTYLAGNGGEYGTDIAVVSAGLVYVTGYTSSTNFPTLNQYQSFSSGSNFHAFVTKLLSLRIDSMLPVAGRAAGGQQITLTGEFVNLSSVKLGGVSATWSYSNGTSQITVTTPAHAVGAVNIVLTPNAGGTYTKTNAFAYLPTTFTDNTLTVGVTTAKGQHIIEIRQAVDALRLVAGQGLANWTDATLTAGSTLIKAVHITEARTNLDAATAALGLGVGSYNDPGLTMGFVIKRVHIEDLRQRIRNIAG